MEKLTPVLAVCLGREFDTEKLAKALPGNIIFTRWEEPVEVNVHGTKTYVFAFGAVVFFGPKSEAVEAFIEKLKKYVAGRVREYWEEYAIIAGKPKEYIGKVTVEGAHIYVGEDGIYAKELPKPVEKILAFVLAQSAALRRMEAAADEVAENIDSVLEELMERSFVFSVKGMRKTLIHALRMRNALLNDLLILEKPSSVWESEEFEELFYLLRTVFDIEDRYQAISKKLSTVVETAEMASELVSDVRFMVLELLIVLFFFIEVVALFLGMW